MVEACDAPLRLPLAWSSVVAEMAPRTSAGLRPMPASVLGSTSTRTAGCCPPPTKTCPTPCTCEIFCARRLLAASEDRCARGSTLLVNAMMRMGASDGFHLAVRGLDRQVGRELAARRRDRGLDVPRGRVDVPVQIELEGDRHGAEGAHRRHLGEPRDAPEPTLERRRHGGRHRLGARAREARAHLDGREIDAGERRDGELEVGGQAGEQDRRGEQGRGDRPPDERGRDVHDAACAGCRVSRRFSGESHRPSRSI